MSLAEFHGFHDSVRWRVTAAGVEIEGSGVERTKGEPRTVTRAWESFGDHINRTARGYRVPCALILATICTESGGKEDAVRLEPGYVSDEKTPGKVSVGLMQTLISTAREALQATVDRSWLAIGRNSIEAGTAYIARQARITRLDPPLVAAAYNAGGLYHQTGSGNRWKLRQYPIGTGAHCDRFVRFFNDAVFVLARHPTRPAVGLDVLLGDKIQVRTGGCAERAAVEIRFGENAKSEDLTTLSRGVLVDVLRTAALRSALVSSTSRSPRDQARVMYDNLERHGVEHQKKLYGPAGDKVIDVYAASKRAGKRPEDIRFDMEEKIRDLGPSNVSRHAADPRLLNVFDVAPTSIGDKAGFERAVKGDRRVAKFLVPPTDPGYHLEVPQR